MKIEIDTKEYKKLCNERDDFIRRSKITEIALYTCIKELREVGEDRMKFVREADIEHIADLYIEVATKVYDYLSHCKKCTAEQTCWSCCELNDKGSRCGIII